MDKSDLFSLCAKLAKQKVKGSYCNNINVHGVLVYFTLKCIYGYARGYKLV